MANERYTCLILIWLIQLQLFVAPVMFVVVVVVVAAAAALVICFWLWSVFLLLLKMKSFQTFLIRSFGKHPRGEDVAGLFEQGTRDLAEFLPACSEPASSPSSSSSSSSSGELRRNFGWESCWKEVITDKGPCYTSSGCITTLCQFDGQKHFVSCTWHFQRLFRTLWRGAAAYTPPRSDFGGSLFGTCTMWG